MNDHINALERRPPVSLCRKVTNDKSAQAFICSGWLIAERGHVPLRMRIPEQMPNHRATDKAGWAGDEVSHASQI